MTDSRALADAVTARLQTATSFLTYRGLILTRPAKNYVCLLFGAGAMQTDRMVGLPTNMTWEFRAVCVGYTDNECLYVAEKIRDLLIGWRPVAALGAGPVNEQPDDPPIIRDDSTQNDVRFSLTLRFSVRVPR